MFTRALTNTWMAFALACAVFVSASIGVTVRYVVGRSVTVSGVVVDARTKTPVKGALVEASKDNAEIAGRTDARGRFMLLHVPHDATVHFSATNYYASASPVSRDPVDLRLRPIPVTGTVTSAFTKKGLAASVVGKVDGRTSPTGAFTVYGVGPGDELTFSAFGHERKSVAIDNSRKVNVTLALGVIDPNALLKIVPGFTHEDAPPSVIAEIRRGIGLSPAAANLVTGVAARLYSKNGKPVAEAAVFAIDPTLAASTATREGFLRGVRANATGVTEVTIGDVVAERFTDQGLLNYAWQEYAAFLVVGGPDAKSVEAVARALILGTTQKV